MRLFATILFASVALCEATEKTAGRWEGVAQIPGHELKLINGTIYFGSTDGNLYAID